MKKVLLHSCCAPCSTTAIKRLIGLYELTIYYYNPNIEPKDEYEKRKKEQIRLLTLLDSNINFIEGDYDNDNYHTFIKDYEELGEHSLRCYKCMELRIINTALKAKELNYDYFATTLSVSPYKNSNWIKEIGLNVQEKYGINYLDENFKKEDGYLTSINESKKYNLYRQDYCGCLHNKPVNE